MDKSLQKLEASLEELVPRGLSDQGRAKCEALIDQLAAGEVTPITEVTLISSGSPIGLSWRSTAAAAAIMLGVGMGSGWYLGQSSPAPVIVAQPEAPTQSEVLAMAFNLMNEKGERQPVVEVPGPMVEGLEGEAGSKEVAVLDKSGTVIKLRFAEPSAK